MNSNTRSKIFAAKERLQQLTQTAREEEEGRVEALRREKDRVEERAQIENTKQHQINKVRLQAEKEKAITDKKEKEEREYLRKHNRTVTKVLSQVAKGTRGGSTSEEEDDEEDDEGRTDDESDQDDVQPTNQGQHAGHNPVASTSTGESERETTCFFNPPRPFSS